MAVGSLTPMLNIDQYIPRGTMPSELHRISGGKNPCNKLTLLRFIEMDSILAPEPPLSRRYVGRARSVKAFTPSLRRYP